eukprot:scaffold24102_cov153-Isochrysis_galbana.AAC.3
MAPTTRMSGEAAISPPAANSANPGLATAAERSCTAVGVSKSRAASPMAMKASCRARAGT